MAAGAVQPLNPLAWLGAPALACVGASLLFTVPLEIAGIGLPQPVFALVTAFAWALIRPSVAAPFVLAFLGLFEDLLSGGRLGLWPCALLAAFGAASIARPVLSGQSFWTLWGWYLGASALAFAVAFALTTVVAGHAPDLVGVVMQYAATGALFWFAWRLIEVYEDADVRFK
jgi:rod shape-determining protein MreD